MCEVYPQRQTELDLYEADIGNIYEHYGEVFYQYHVQFSKRASAYLEKGIKIDWTKHNKDLFQLLIGGAKTNFVSTVVKLTTRALSVQPKFLSCLMVRNLMKELGQIKTLH